jgi:hypothetical protein
MRPTIAALAVLSLVACAGPGAIASGEPSSNLPSRELSPSAAASLAPASEQPSRSAAAEMDATITGSISFDEIEGGCTSFEALDGTRYELILPDGWTLDSNSNLSDPSGEIVAGIGDTVTVGGRVANDMASICQIGPIFQAVDIHRTD